ncbi:hypothetical protein DMH01_14510 [Amycolatopsis sp. WAC 04182]|nr:hypothetical protein DMH01_14510 [Amycolatopsis sp. WAC 04182]
MPAVDQTDFAHDPAVLSQDGIHLFMRQLRGESSWSIKLVHLVVVTLFVLIDPGVFTQVSHRCVRKPSPDVKEVIEFSGHVRVGADCFNYHQRVRDLLECGSNSQSEIFASSCVDAVTHVRIVGLERLVPSDVNLSGCMQVRKGL